jgi:molybdate transport system permease protein
MLGRLALALVIAIILSFLFLPLFSVFITMGPVELFTNLNTPIAYQALFLSLKTSFTSLVLIVAFGTPLARSGASESSRSACRCQ